MIRALIPYALGLAGALTWLPAGAALLEDLSSPGPALWLAGATGSLGAAAVSGRLAARGSAAVTCSEAFAAGRWSTPRSRSAARRFESSACSSASSSQAQLPTVLTWPPRRSWGATRGASAG